MERPNWAGLYEMVGDIQKTLANIDDIQKQVRAVTAEAWSADRMIHVTVGPRGQIIDLEIDPRVYRKPNSKALAGAVVSTVRAAVEQAARVTNEIVERYTPSDIRAPFAESELGRLMSMSDAQLKDVVGDER